MGTIKDIYDIIKELATDAMKMTDKVLANEFYGKLLEVQEKLLDIRQENFELSEENRNLKSELEKIKEGINSAPKSISWNNGVGTFKDEKDITHWCCQLCYTKTNKIIELTNGMGYVNKICPNCKTNYRLG